MKANTKNMPTVNSETLRDFKRGRRGENRLQYRIQSWIEDYRDEKWPDANRFYVIDMCMERLRTWIPKIPMYKLVAGDKKLFKTLVAGLVDEAAQEDLGLKHKPFSFARFNKERYTRNRVEVTSEE